MSDGWRFNSLYGLVVSACIVGAANFLDSWPLFAISVLIFATALFHGAGGRNEQGEDG